LRILEKLPGQNNNFSDEYYAEKLAEKSNTFSGENITCNNFWRFSHRRAGMYQFLWRVPHRKAG
jgi:phage-related protein